MSKETAPQASQAGGQAQEKPVKNKENTLNQLEQQVGELQSQLQRALADYDNLKRRVEREAQDFEPRIKSRIFGRIIPVLDMFYDIQSHLQDGGLAMAIGELENNLREENIVKIEVEEGDKFNEELHEAIDALETKDKKQKGTIKELTQTGWRLLEGPVIRHAKVVVFK